MKIRCRAHLSKKCYDGEECKLVYGEDSMADDGTFDGETVVCDPCYIAGGQPSLSSPATRAEVVRHVNRALGLEE